MRLAGVVLQLDWQAALEGSQMTQKPAEFARIAEASVASNMDRIHLEASSRGWLSSDLPSGTPSVGPSCTIASWLCTEGRVFSADARRGTLRAMARLGGNLQVVKLTDYGCRCAPGFAWDLQAGMREFSWRGTAQAAR